MQSHGFPQELSDPTDNRNQSELIISKTVFVFGFRHQPVTLNALEFGNMVPFFFFLMFIAKENYDNNNGIAEFLS